MKYLAAYSIPLVAIFGILNEGIWNYITVIYTFGFIPIVEILLPINEENYSETEIVHKIQNKIYDYLLYGNTIIVYGLLWISLQKVSHTNLTTTSLIGIILSLGIVLGANGINVAHELGHREKRWERILGKILLIPSHYTHFYIEHNHGHHLHVSTPEDPSTAKKNQSLYAFWIQTVTGTYQKAWQIQKRLNKTNHIQWYSIQNDMLWFTIIQISYIMSIYFLFGKLVLLVAIAAGVIGFLLLETINYIEHYGLERKITANGRYERVSEKHSWNSNHVLGRILLYELTRHSDHHYKSQKKYQILEYHEVSPQMPFGYPTSMVLSFIPPLWFYIMNKKIPTS